MHIFARGFVGRFVAAFLLAVLFGVSPDVLAQVTVDGSIENQSTWEDQNSGTSLANPPGNGDNVGTLYVGLWNAVGAGVSGAPVLSAVVSGPAALPFPTGTVGPYNIGGVLQGAYKIAAWVDADGDNGYDLGEPRSVSTDLNVTTNAVAGVNLIVVDDSDNDGMADWWEAHWFSGLANSLSLGAGDDPDVDGLTNKDEYDIARLAVHFISLNPNNWDTDGDLMDDGWEYDFYASGFGTDPMTIDAIADPDGEGLSNAQEYRGVNGEPRREQDPTKPVGIGRINADDVGFDSLSPIDLDTDADTLIDSFEAAWYDSPGGLDPRTANLSSFSADVDGDGLTAYREQCLLLEFREGAVHDIWTAGSISLPGTDPSGLRDFNPPLAIGSLLVPLISTALPVLRANEWTDPTEGTSYSETLIGGSDCDHDLLPDGWEVEYNLDPRSNAGNNGFWGDPDGDGLINYEEYYGQDGDRASDSPNLNGTGDETNPNQHNWRPMSTGKGPGTQRPPVSATDWTSSSNSSTAGTLGAALPTASLGTSGGDDTDDDLISDDFEIQQEFYGGYIGSSPVHSMDPFYKTSMRITGNAGIPVPDPEGGDPVYGGWSPTLHDRNWTIECYVKLLSSGLSGDLMDCPGAESSPIPDSRVWRLSLANDVPMVSFDTLGGTRYYVEGLALPTNRWIHLAGVWSTAANSLSLYVDGIFVQETRIYQEGLGGFLFPSSNALTIGRSLDGSFANKIMMDEIRIWGLTRTPDEIEQYRTRLVPQYSRGLLAYYRFDDWGLTAEDFARKAQNGLLGAKTNDYYYGDHGYGLSGGFAFDITDWAPVRGVDVRGADDSDGDGMPDGWEMINSLDPFSAVGVDGRDGDSDGDTLKNIYEYWSDTNPQAQDTDGDGIFDGNEDKDGEGLVNRAEQDLNCRPDMINTDDDGLADNEEQARGSSPANPTDPSISRCMVFGGASNDFLVVPNAFSQRLTDWTLEAWVKPTNGIGGVGYIVRRVVETPASGNTAVNFVLGIGTNTTGIVPYAGYSFTNGSNYIVWGSGNLSTTGAWIHLSASYDSLNARLVLYTNGVLSGTPITTAYLAPPRNGKGGETSLRIGEDFQGEIDEVRIWNDVRTSTELVQSYDESFGSIGIQGLVHSFRFDDGQATEDAFPFGTYHEKQGPQDFCFSEDWNQEWFHAAQINNNVDFVRPGAIVLPPTISVIIEPFEARNKGAAWTLDSTTWNNSGQVLTTTEGAHTLGYKSIVGWRPPAGEGVSLTNGEALTLTRTYIQDGSLRVLIEPLEVSTNGGEWNVDGGAWTPSGIVVSNLAVGNHTVTYKSVPGWTAPPSADAAILAGQQTQIIGTYTAVVGTLRVYIEPAAVVSNGAQWRVDSSVWMDSGSSTNLRYGSHTVEFSDVPPWITPADKVFVVTLDTNSVTTGRYEQVTGVQVIIGPPAALAAGAQWRVNEGAWQGSGNIVAVAAGSHTISFSDIGILRTPANMTVNVVSGAVEQVFASYYDVDFWGKFGTGTGQFRDPRSVVANLRYAYVADWGNDRIQRLDTLSGAWSVLGSVGSGAGQFNQPMGVALDASGNLWVADAGNARIQKRTLSTGAWTTYGSSGDGVGQLNGPFGLDLDSHGNVYVVDYYNNRVQKMTPAGVWSVFVATGAEDGKVQHPYGVCVDQSNWVYVTDYNLSSGRGRVQKFNEAGVFLQVMGYSLNARSKGPDTDVRTNELHVCDTELGSIRYVNIFDTNLLWNTSVGQDLVSEPYDCGFDPWGNMYIADAGSNRIVRINAGDSDNDRMPDWVESIVGTVTNDSDSDGDGVLDGIEGIGGTDPLDPFSTFLTPLSPTGTVANPPRPVFTWTEDPFSTCYYLWISRNGTTYKKLWVNSATNWGTGMTNWLSGTYDWWIRGWNTFGYTGDWSVKTRFIIPSYVPGAVTPITPSGTVNGTNRPAFTWSLDGNAEQYNVWVNKNGSVYFKQWVVGATNYTRPTALPFANYTWWVRAWSRDGYGPWSSSKAFSLGIPMPLTPRGATVNPVTITWQEVSNATQYQLWLNRNGATYNSGIFYPGGTTNTVPLVLPNGYTYRVWARALNGTVAGPYSIGVDFTVP